MGEEKKPKQWGTTPMEMRLSVSSIFIVCCLCLNIVECSHTSSSFLESFIEPLLTFSMSIHVPQSPIFKIISEDCSPDTSSEALNHMLLVATPSVISHLWGRPLSPDGFTSCHLPSSHQTLPPHRHPHLTLFLVSCLAWRWWVVRQFWCDVRRDWTTTAEQLLSPSLSYLFFLCAT